jgi:hypothetical protein
MVKSWIGLTTTNKKALLVTLTAAPFFIRDKTKTEGPVYLSETILPGGAGHTHYSDLPESLAARMTGLRTSMLRRGQSLLARCSVS